LSAREHRGAPRVMRVFGISWIAGYPESRRGGFIGEGNREDDSGIPPCVLLALGVSPCVLSSRSPRLLLR
jgi:hypothetical protein